MTLARVLDAPVPVAAAALQVVPGIDAGNAGWFTGALFGVWLVLWFLDRIGKLPGKPAGGVHAGFHGEDRRKAERVHSLLATEDEDGVPRFLKHVIETHVAVERQGVYVETTSKLHKLIEDHHKLVGMVTDQLRIQNQRIGAVEKSVDQLKSDYNDLAAG